MAGGSAPRARQGREVGKRCLQGRLAGWWGLERKGRRESPDPLGSRSPYMHPESPLTFPGVFSSFLD